MRELRKVDVAVIGAGSGGLGARRQAAKLGVSTVMIEAGPYGTTCARVGCMPSKVLISSAEMAHKAHRSDDFCVSTGPIKVDGRGVFERVRALRDRFTGGVVRMTERIPEAARLRGRARFVSPSRLALDDGTEIEAGAVVIATGSYQWVPPMFRDLGARLITSEEVFELDDVPESLAVIGAGVIGIELGQALARLGARTRFLAIDDLIGPLTDPEVKAAAREVMSEELTLDLEVEFLAVEARAEGVLIRWRAPDGSEHEDIFEKVLAATGRRPNLADLGLEHTGLELQHNGVPVHDPLTMRCGESNIFLAGDVTGTLALLHEASDEGRIAGSNAARVIKGEPVHEYARRTPVGAVFCDPQIGLAGKTYRELEGREDVVIGTLSWAGQGRALVMGEDHGALRVYARRFDGRLLGAEMCGPRPEHLAHLLAWSIQREATVYDCLRMPFYHPVFEEGLRTALRQLRDQLDHPIGELRSTQSEEAHLT